MTSFELEVGSRLYYFIKYKILGFLGLLILVLTVYVAFSVFHNSDTNPLSGSQDLVIFVSLAMMYVGFAILRITAPQGDCDICGKTDVEVTSWRDVNYCERCIKNGDAQRYFDEKDERESEARSRTQPQIEEHAPTQAAPPPQVMKETIREREVIHDTIVKIRCGHCHRLYEEEKGSCPYCGAPI